MALLNGKQIKDTSVALDKLNGSGLVAITGEMNFGVTASLKLAGTPQVGFDATNKAYVDTEIAKAISTGASASYTLTNDIQDEMDRAILAEGVLNASVDSLDAALTAEINATNADVTAINASVDSLESALTTEINATNADVTAINASVDSVEARLLVEEGRVDAILFAAGASTDSFAEIVALINTVDTANDTAFGGYALNTDASIDSLEVALSTEINATNADVSALNASVDSLELLGSGNVSALNASVDSLESALTAEIAATDSDVTAINASIDSLENALSVEIVATNADVTALNASVDSLESALTAEINATNADVTALNASVDSLESALTAEINATNADVTAINASVDSVEARLLVEEGRVDAILFAAGASTDSFAEIVALINTVDTANDTAFGGYALNTDASIDSLEVALSTEINATNADVSALNASVDSLEAVLTAEIESVDVRVSAIESGIIAVSVTEDDFKMDTFTGSGLTYTLTSAPAVNKAAVVTAFVNGLYAPIASVTDGVVLLNVSYTIDAGDLVSIKYIVD